MTARHSRSSRLAQIHQQYCERTQGRRQQRGLRSGATGYAAAAMSRKIRRATRGSTLDSKLNRVNDIFATESSLKFSFDYFEVGLADGPGSWDSVAGGTLTALTAVIPPQGSAEACPSRAGFRHRLAVPRPINLGSRNRPALRRDDRLQRRKRLFYVWIKARAGARHGPNSASLHTSTASRTSD